MNIRTVKPTDAKAIVDIYNYYIENTTITFEVEPLTEEDMRIRIQDISEQHPYFVCESDGVVLGYCYVSFWHKRCAYHNTLELSIYVDHNRRGQGVGHLLMCKMLDTLRNSTCHVVMACISIPNESSVGMHEKFGFKQVSHFKEVGNKFDQWLDVGDWELIL